MTSWAGDDRGELIEGARNRRLPRPDAVQRTALGPGGMRKDPSRHNPTSVQFGPPTGYGATWRSEHFPSNHRQLVVLAARLRLSI
jgi:hypothetical protein